MSEVTTADTAGSAPYYYQPELEKLPREQLEALQFERLQSILAHAYANVAHFRGLVAAVCEALAAQGEAR